MPGETLVISTSRAARWPRKILANRGELFFGAAVVLVLVAPVAASDATSSKPAIGAAALLSLPMLALAAHRNDPRLGELRHHPLSAFVTLYLLCAVVGGATGLVRGILHLLS